VNRLRNGVVMQRLAPLAFRLNLPNNRTKAREAPMQAVCEPQTVPKAAARKLSGIGATEDQMNARATIPQRNDSHGTKLEDLAGTGDQDSPGG
jgi:hypothetical protein